jgi:hypothetical protein
MKLSARLLTSDDYHNTLTKWWKDWRWTPPSVDFLPDNFNGIMVSYGDVDVCACFLYMTNSNIVWMEFIISNFEVKDRDVRNKSMEYMINIVKGIAKDFNRKYVMSNVKNPSLINRLSESGFHKGSSNVQELIYIVKNGSTN